MLTITATKSVPRARRLGLWLLAAFMALVASYSAMVALLPAQAPALSQSIHSRWLETGVAPQLDWPGAKQAAVGAVGHGIVASNGQEVSAPMASTAKVIAALAILQKAPLSLGELGQTFTYTKADETNYFYYANRGGSVVHVKAGEQINQYQALQAMLIPSANNIAKSATGWVFGSEAEYVAYANQMLADLGLTNTHVADASGFSEATVSTARDLVVIGQKALANPVIAEIVAQTEATIPVHGKIVTTNKVMGQAGIDGIKTGHTNASGGCFLFSASRNIDGEQVRVVAAIMGAPSIESARASAPGLIEAVSLGFEKIVGLSADQQVATLTVPWADPISIVAEDDLQQIAWKGTDLKMDLSVTASSSAGLAGSASIGTQTTSLLQQQDVPAPSYWWRFTHPLDLLGAL